MKKIYLLLIFTLLNGFAYTQEEYYPIPENNVYWTVTEFNYYDNEYDDFLYTVDGDTIIDGLSYKQVFKLNDYPTIYDTISSLHCLMRQDSAQKKVWFIRTYLGDSIEKLGYDFNVEIGDTVNLPALDFGYTRDPRFVVQNIEYVDIQYLGEMKGLRKFYFLTNVSENGYTIEYVEGLVEYRSLFPNLDTIWYYDAFHQTYTWCMQQNRIYGYARAGDNEPPENYCGFILMDVKNNDISDHISVNPNPADNYLNIGLPDDLSKVNSVAISNLTGQIVQSKEIRSLSKNINLDVSKLISGLYILHINMDDMIAVKKIVIRH